MKHAFTLIELLVVIAIISLLVGILMPALGAAREAARQSVCASNLRNMVLGVRVYACRHDGWLPMAEPPLREFPDERHWFMNAALLQSMGVDLRKSDDRTPLGPPMEGSILICPSHADPCRWRDGTLTGYALSYGMNGTWGVGGRPDHLEQRRLGQFTSESGVMVFMDACGTAVAPGIVLYHGCPADNMDFRHRGKANVAFLDGHVEALGPDDVPMGFSNRYTPFWSTPKP